MTRRPAARSTVVAATVLAVGLASTGCVNVPAEQLGTSPPPTRSSSTRAATQRAAAVCAEHFPSVGDAVMVRVGDIRQLGPHVSTPPPGPLDAFPDDALAALCLVPSSSMAGMYDAVAVVLSDGTTVVRWTQNIPDQLDWPI